MRSGNQTVETNLLDQRGKASIICKVDSRASCISCHTYHILGRPSLDALGQSKQGTLSEVDQPATRKSVPVPAVALGVPARTCRGEQRSQPVADAQFRAYADFNHHPDDPGSDHRHRRHRRRRQTSLRNPQTSLVVWA